MARQRKFIPYHYGNLNAVLEKPRLEPRRSVFWLVARVILLGPGAIWAPGGAWYELATTARIITAGFYLGLGLFLLGVAVLAAADLLRRAMAFRRRAYNRYVSLEITECVVLIVALNVVAIENLLDSWAAGKWAMVAVCSFTPVMTMVAAVALAGVIAFDVVKDRMAWHRRNRT